MMGAHGSLDASAKIKAGVSLAVIAVSGLWLAFTMGWLGFGGSGYEPPMSDEGVKGLEPEPPPLDLGPTVGG